MNAPIRLDKRIRTYGPSATTFLLTILRVIVLEQRGEVWTSALIEALAACGIQERSARQTINRLAKQTRLIRSERLGARSRWWLTEEGKKRLVLGQRRVARFQGVQEDWDGQWLMVVCSVPERQRDIRRRYRGRLEFSGFGFINPTIAVSTHLENEPFVNEVLKDFGLLGDALVLKARPGAIVSDELLLKRAWDIQALQKNYAMFIDLVKHKRPQTDQQKFAAYIELERAWFYVASVDPELPQALLHARWSGSRAKEMYEARGREWRAAAIRWFKQINGVASH